MNRSVMDPTPRTTRPLDCLVIEAGAHVCAVPLPAVVETLRPLAIERLPEMAAGILGLSIIRGGAVPVIDLAALFRDAPASGLRRWALVRGDARLLALAVTDVLGVRALEVDGGTGLELVAPFVSAVARDGRRLVTVIAVARILPAPVRPERAGEPPHG